MNHEKMGMKACNQSKLILRLFIVPNMAPCSSARVRGDRALEKGPFCDKRTTNIASLALDSV